MKPALPFNKHLGILFILIFAISFAKAATITSNGSGGGDWNDRDTWSGRTVPGASDVVIIVSGDDVTINVANAACASLNINSGSGNGTATIEFNNRSVLTVSGTVTIGGGGNRKGSIDMTDGGTFSAQQFTISKAGTWTEGNGTITLTGTNTLTNSFFTTFNNLTIGAGTTSMGAALTVDNNLSIADGATFNAGAYTLTVTGTTTVGAGTSGSLNITSATGTKTFGDLVTVSAGATWNNSGNSAITFKGGITNHGTFTAGSGVHTFSSNAQSLTGTFAIPNVTVAAITLTNKNTLTVSTVLAGSGRLTQSANATLNIGGTWTITGLTATATGNTVNYTGTSQNVKSTNYYNLTLSGSGTDVLATGTTAIGGDFTLSGTVTTATVVDLTISGDLSVGDGTTFSAAGFDLTVTDATTIGSGTSGTMNITSATGTKTFGDLVTVSAGATWNNSGNSAITFKGGITNNGTFTAGSGVHTFSSNTQSLTGTFAIPNVTVATITLTNKNTLTVSTVLAGSGRLTQSANATLNIGGTWTITGLTATATGNMVNYTGASQNVKNTNYYNLTLSGSGTDVLATGTTAIGGDFTLSGTVTTKTVVGLTISGNLSTGDGTSFTVQGFDFTVTGTTTIGSGTSGTMIISATAGTKTFEGLIRINTGATWNNSGNSALTFHGGINYTGTSFTAGSAVYTFNTNNQSLTGTLTIPNVTVTGVTLTNNNSLTVSTALIGTGGLTQATNAALNIGGTSTITTLTATATGNTVNYTGAAQTVKAANYYHLTLSGSGTDVMQTGTTSISGNFTLGGTVSTTAVAALTIGGDLVIAGTSFNAGSFTHNIGGNWQFNAGTFTPGTSTINFNGTSAAQTIGGSKATVFNNLTIANSNGVSLDDGTNNFSKTVSGVLTLTNGLLTTTASNLLILASGGSVVATTPDPVGNPNYYTASSYVDGPMQATITSTSGLTFPIGKSGTGYVPITVSKLFGSSPVPQIYTAEYFHVKAGTMGPIDVGSPQLDHVSGCDYWRLDLGATYPTSTNSSLPNGVTTNITMFWNANNSAGCTTDYVTSFANLVIAHLNFMTGYSYAGRWTAVGGAYNYAGSTTNGSISYVGASTFSPFTLGGTNGTQNPLDIKLDYFTAVKAGTSNKISWKAECSSSSNIFEAQRSADGVNFKSIDTVRVDAQSDCSKGFVYNDYSIADSKIYYRIKTTDVDGVVGYSETKLISNQSGTFEFITVSPNPVKNNATLSISAAADEKIDVVILSIEGREIQHRAIQLQNGVNNINLQTSELPKGMYFIKGIFSSGQTNTIKFIKE